MIQKNYTHESCTGAFLYFGGRALLVGGALLSHRLLFLAILVQGVRAGVARDGGHRHWTWYTERGTHPSTNHSDHLVNHFRGKHSSVCAIGGRKILYELAPSSSPAEWIL